MILRSAAGCFEGEAVEADSLMVELVRCTEHEAGSRIEFAVTPRGKLSSLSSSSPSSSVSARSSSDQSLLSSTLMVAPPSSGGDRL